MEKEKCLSCYSDQSALRISCKLFIVQTAYTNIVQLQSVELHQCKACCKSCPGIRILTEKVQVTQSYFKSHIKTDIPLLKSSSAKTRLPSLHMEIFSICQKQKSADNPGNLQFCTLNDDFAFCKSNGM